MLPLAALSLVVACGETITEMPIDGEPALEAAMDGYTRMYEVTVTNYTGGQPLTPPIVATHNGEVDVFTPGQYASYEVKEIARSL